MIVVNVGTWEILVNEDEFVNEEKAYSLAEKRRRQKVRALEIGYSHNKGDLTRVGILAMRDHALEIMTYSEYMERKRGFYLNQPIQEVSSEDWDSIYNAMPNAKKCSIDQVKLITEESLDDIYAIQYASYGYRYYTKIVDGSDETTWLHNYIKTH